MYKIYLPFSQIAISDPILPQNPVSNATLDEEMKFVSNFCQLLDSPTDKFSELLGLKIAKRNESMGKLSYMVSNYAILEVAENVFHIGSGF